MTVQGFYPRILLTAILSACDGRTILCLFMDSPLFSYNPYPLLLSVSRHNFDLLGDSSPEGKFSEHFFHYSTTENYTIITDRYFKVESFSCQAVSFFGAILDSQPDFSSLLAPESNILWKVIKNKACFSANFNGYFQMTYIKQDYRLVPAFCAISRMLDEEMKLAIHISVPDFSAFSHLESEFSFGGGAKKAKAVHDYIYTHLDQPLPTLKELSVLFGTSVSVLKISYKNYFNTSIHKSYNEARMQKAIGLLREGTPPSEAAFSCGFQNYMHFLKAFKKRFGLLPSKVYRR